LYLSVAGACAEQKANAGGGGGGSSATGNEFIQMATNPTGIYQISSTGQALEFGINNPLHHPTQHITNNSFNGNMDIVDEFEVEIENYSEIIEADFLPLLGYSTGTSPTRDIVHVPFSVASFASNINGNGYSASAKPRLLIGGYIRGWDAFNTANNSGLTSPIWTVNSSALISSSISNSCSVGLVDAVNTRVNTQDNRFATNATGIYVNSGTTTSSFKLLEITLGGSGKSFTFPAIGDTFTLRVKADGTMAGATQTQRNFDIKVTWI